MQEKVAVIFDMDGVIIDSNPLVTKTWKELLQHHSMALGDELLKQKIFGRTTEDTIKNVFGADVTETDMRQYKNFIDQRVRELYKEEGKIVPGFKFFVQSLINHHIAVAIATSAPYANVEIVMDIGDTASLFTIISHAADVKKSKPDPEIYLITAAKLNIPPARCCVFEDSISGIQSAKAAGMTVVGVTTTHTVDELLSIADAAIDDFTTVSPDWIRNLIR